MKSLCPLLVALLAISGSFGVDRNIFKTCEQSGFCKRLRAFKPERSQYVADFTTIMLHDNMLFLDVNTVDLESEKKTVLLRYVLKVSALMDSTFRVEMEEVHPLYPRFITLLALKDTPIADSLKEVSRKDGRLTVENSKGHRVVITADPLKIEFVDKDGEVAVVFNENSQLHVEPLVSKEDRVDENGDIIPEEEGTWGENFKSHHDSKPRGNEAISLDIGFPDADHVYGIPEHTDKLALTTTTSGEPYRLYNLDVFEYELDSRMAIYGAVPVLYAHGMKRTVGVFWHNSAETWVDVANIADGTVVSSLVNLVTGGHKRRVDTRFLSESGLIDVFVFMGDRPADVFRQYTRLTGTAALPPKFSLGYHQCRWNYVDEADVRGVDENFDVHDIPADVIWLDIEYTNTKKYFTWDAEKFPHPAEMVANLTAKGRKLVTIIDPHIKREAGYFLHEDATEKGYYVKDKDGKDYEGWCWPGSSSYIDFFNPEANQYYADRYRFENFPGTSKDVHIWNDMNEPSVFNGPEITMPKDCRHWKEPQEGVEGIASFWEHRHIHNEYGLWNIRATHQGLLQRTDNKYRPFILTRSAFAGTQRFAAVWTGDNMAEWGYLAASVPMCLSLAIAGISFCGSDVGGFFKYPEAELMTRWYQAGAFQPFFRAHSHIETKRREPWLYEPATTALIRDANRRRYALIDLWPYTIYHIPHSHIETKRREPWLYEPATTALIRDANRRRYALIDFWYTLFYEHTKDGLPVMRPLFQEYPKEEATFTIDDQYLLGDKLLVAPVLSEGATSVKVYFPGADTSTVWYDVDSYQAHAANGFNTISVNMAKIPVYQRGGTIVPRKERVRRSTPLMANDPYTLVVALDANERVRRSTPLMANDPYTLVVALDANNTARGSLYIDDGETYEYKKKKYIYAKFAYSAEEMTYTFVNDKATYPTQSWVERIVIAGIKVPPKSARLQQGGRQVALQMTLHRGNDVLVVRKPAANMAQPWTITFSY